MGCADCPYCVDGLRDENDQLCCACTKMPSNKPWGCGYMEIDGIDHILPVKYPRNNKCNTNLKDTLRRICMSDDYRMRKCGEGWEYCNGKCSECPKTHIVTTNHT